MPSRSVAQSIEPLSHLSPLLLPLPSQDGGGTPSTKQNHFLLTTRTRVNMKGSGNEEMKLMESDDSEKPLEGPWGLGRFREPLQKEPWKAGGS